MQCKRADLEHANLLPVVIQGALARGLLVQWSGRLKRENSFLRNGAGEGEFRNFQEHDARDYATDRGTIGRSTPSYRWSACLRGEA